MKDTIMKYLALALVALFLMVTSVPSYASDSDSSDPSELAAKTDTYEVFYRQGPGLLWKSYGKYATLDGAKKVAHDLEARTGDHCRQRLVCRCRAGHVSAYCGENRHQPGQNQ